MLRHEGKAGEKDNLGHRSAWCTVELGDKIFQARVSHIGRGKFKILQDNQDDRYVGKAVDASDIFGCDTERSERERKVEVEGIKQD